MQFLTLSIAEIIIKKAERNSQEAAEVSSTIKPVPKRMKEWEQNYFSCLDLIPSSLAHVHAV